jgi:DNA processing protein
MAGYKNTTYIAALASLDMVGISRLESLMRYFGTGEHIWSASVHELIAAGLDHVRATSCAHARELFDLDQMERMLIGESISVIDRNDAAYPADLGTVYDPPYVLFIKGTLPIAGQLCVGVVGARRATQYGMIATYLLTRELSHAGTCIVSGLALGIDAAAHAATLESGGKTIAVLAGGINAHSVYPRTNAGLAARIVAAGGCLLSEQPPGTQPQKYHFPLRNRIIAGLSRAVVIIEAGKTSGSLATASYALQEGREVFAVPGPITSDLSYGTNDLLRQGAHIATSADDILSFYDIAKPLSGTANKEASHGYTDVENKILSQLGAEPVHIDFVTLQSQLDTPTASSTLLILEMKGAVKDVGNKMYIRLHE